VLAVLPDGPGRIHARLHDVLCAALEQTSHEALFVTPYFLPGSRLCRAMTDAVERGVCVEVLVAGDSDHPLVECAVRDLLPPFLQRGVRVFEYEGALMHAKAAIFDARWAIVGTSNLDQQSFHHGYEVNVVAREGVLPAQLAAIVRDDLKDARRVTSEVLARRPLLRRLRDRAAAAVVRRL
jgi:cardiolipin synthase